MLIDKIQTCSQIHKRKEIFFTVVTGISWTILGGDGIPICVQSDYTEGQIASHRIFKGSECIYEGFVAVGAQESDMSNKKWIKYATFIFLAWFAFI